MYFLKYSGSLLLLVNCFFVNAGTLYCNAHDVKIKPVFINGMFNSRDVAKYKTKLVYQKVKNLYGGNISSKSDDYYAAINEFDVLQIPGVLLQYMYNLRNNPDYEPSDEEKDSIINAISESYILNDDDLNVMIADLEGFYDEDYRFMFTSHSQGTVYYNLLFEKLLSKWDKSRYRSLSLGAAVTTNDPNGIMLMQKDDWIKGLGALEPYSDNGELYNISNGDKKGHSFNSYFYGNNTSFEIDKIYKNMISDLTIENKKFYINMRGSYLSYGNAEQVHVAVEEAFYLSKDDTKAESYHYGSTEGVVSNILRGDLSRGDGYITYSMDCGMLSEKTEIGVQTWNFTESPIRFYTDYSMLEVEDVEDRVIFYNENNLGKDISHYVDVGHKLIFTKQEGNVFDIEAERTEPYFEDIINITFDDMPAKSIYVCESYRHLVTQESELYCSNFKGKGHEGTHGKSKGEISFKNGKWNYKITDFYSKLGGTLDEYIADLVIGLELNNMSDTPSFNVKIVTPMGTEEYNKVVRKNESSTSNAENIAVIRGFRGPHYEVPKYSLPD